MGRPLATRRVSNLLVVHFIGRLSLETKPRPKKLANFIDRLTSALQILQHCERFGVATLPWEMLPSSNCEYLRGSVGTPYAFGVLFIWSSIIAVANLSVIDRNLFNQSISHKARLCSAIMSRLANESDQSGT